MNYTFPPGLLPRVLLTARPTRIGHAHRGFHEVGVTETKYTATWKFGGSFQRSKPQKYFKRTSRQGQQEWLSDYCSCRGSEFRSQDSHQTAHHSPWLQLHRDLTSSSGLYNTCTQVVESKESPSHVSTVWPFPGSSTRLWIPMARWGCAHVSEVPLACLL